MSTQAINLTSVFPSYLSFLWNLKFETSTLNNLVVSITVFVTVSFVIFLILSYLRLKRSLDSTYTFLEVKPPYNTLQSAFSTNQLFGVIHSLQRHTSFINTLLKVKHTISCELVSTKEEGIRYILRIPANDVSAVKKSLLAYLSSIEIKEIADYLKPYQASSSNQWRIGEFNLSKPFVIPLKDQSLLDEYDPIAYITSHMTKLKAHEMVVFQVICSPVTANTHSNVISHINKLQNQLSNNLDITKNLDFGVSKSIYEGFRQPTEYLLHITLSVLLLPLEVLASIVGNAQTSSPLKYLTKTKQKSISELGEAKKQMHQKVAAKINQPLFETSIRIFIKGNDHQTINSRLAGIRSSLAAFSTDGQGLRVSKFPILSHWQFIKHFDYLKLKYRQLSLVSNPIFSLTELSSLYHLPYTATPKPKT